MALLRRLASLPPRWAAIGAVPLSALAAPLGAPLASPLRLAGGGVSRCGRPAPAQRATAAMSTAPPLPTVAWVGLGAMGVPMASRLAAAGVCLRVWDAAPAAVDAFVHTLPPLSAGAGGRVTPVGRLEELFPVPPPSADADPPPPPPAADTPPPVALITMLPSTAAVAATLVALAPRAPPGAVLIDMSTIPPDESRGLASRVAAATAAGGDRRRRHVHVLDAPVSGGTAAAAAGTLTIMVGGAAGTVAALSPLLSLMGRPVHVGGPGSGQVVKAANNLVLGATMAAVAEATALAAAAGVPPATTAAVLAASSGRSWAGDVYHPAAGVVAGAPAGRGYTGGFRVELMRKDLGIARGMGAAGGGKTPTPMADAADGVYRAMGEGGGAGKDFSGIYEYVYKGARGDKPAGAVGA